PGLGGRAHALAVHGRAHGDAGLVGAGGPRHPRPGPAAGLRGVVAARHLVRAADARADAVLARLVHAADGRAPLAHGAARLHAVPRSVRVRRDAHALAGGGGAVRDAGRVHAGDGGPPVAGPVARLHAVARALLVARHARALAGGHAAGDHAGREHA